jgi:hypothetical protein
MQQNELARAENGQYSPPDQKRPELNVDRIDTQREPETSGR